MNKKNNNIKLTVKLKETPLEIYCHTVYKFFGRKALLNKKFNFFFFNHFYNKRYETILRKANLKLIPEEYFFSILFSMMFLTVFALFSSIIFFFLNQLIAFFIFYGGILLISGSGIFLYNYPLVISKNRKDEIDASMPYLLPYMKILSKELNLSKIIEIIDGFLIYQEVKNEFQKIKYYSTILGYDIHSSIREAMLSCPSQSLSDVMNDLVTISNSGGDIYGYLSRKLENLNQEIDAIEKKNIDTLLIYSQIYVVILLIAPLFYTIMTSILNLIDFNSIGTAGVSTGSTFYSILVLLLALPFVYTGFMMLVYYSKPLYSRLQPIKDD